MYKRILLAYDGSPSGQKALLDCQDIAQWSGAELTLVTVQSLHMNDLAIEGGVYDSSWREREETAMREVLNDGLSRLQAAGHKADCALLQGDAVGEITKHAETIGADLIVVGHKHLDGWAARWWKGSVYKSLIERAHCSVLIAITD